MTLPLRISEEAAAEMVEAARWYETHRAGLGTDFLDAVDDTVSRIAKAPRIGSSVPGISDPMIRRTPVRRFPYHVVYLELPARLQILAIAHDRRRPGYWVGRLPLDLRRAVQRIRRSAAAARVLPSVDRRTPARQPPTGRPPAVGPRAATQAGGRLLQRLVRRPPCYEAFRRR